MIALCTFNDMMDSRMMRSDLAESYSCADACACANVVMIHPGCVQQATLSLANARASHTTTSSRYVWGRRVSRWENWKQKMDGIFKLYSILWFPPSSFRSIHLLLAGPAMRDKDGSLLLPPLLRLFDAAADWEPTAKGIPSTATTQQQHADGGKHNVHRVQSRPVVTDPRQTRRPVAIWPVGEQNGGENIGNSRPPTFFSM